MRIKKLKLVKKKKKTCLVQHHQAGSQCLNKAVRLHGPRKRGHQKRLTDGYSGSGNFSHDTTLHCFLGQVNTSSFRRFEVYSVVYKNYVHSSVELHILRTETCIYKNGRVSSCVEQLGPMRLWSFSSVKHLVSHSHIASVSYSISVSTHLPSRSYCYT